MASRERDVKDLPRSWNLVGGREIHDRQSETVTPFSLLTPLSSPLIHSEHRCQVNSPNASLSCHFCPRPVPVAHTQRHPNPITTPHFMLLLFSNQLITTTTKTTLNDAFGAGTVGQALLPSLGTQGQTHRGPCRRCSREPGRMPDSRRANRSTG